MINLSFFLDVLNQNGNEENVPSGIRTRMNTLKGCHPEPLDDGDKAGKPARNLNQLQRKWTKEMKRIPPPTAAKQRTIRMRSSIFCCSPGAIESKSSRNSRFVFSARIKKWRWNDWMRFRLFYGRNHESLSCSDISYEEWEWAFPISEYSRENFGKETISLNEDEEISCYSSSKRTSGAYLSSQERLCSRQESQILSDEDSGVIANGGGGCDEDVHDVIPARTEDKDNQSTKYLPQRIPKSDCPT